MINEYIRFSAIIFQPVLFPKHSDFVPITTNNQIFLLMHYQMMSK